MARTKRKNLLKLENKDEEDDDPEDDQQQEQEQQEQQQQADEEQEQQEQAEEDQNGGEQAEEEDENANLEVRVQRLLIIIPSLPAESSKQAENVAPAMAAASTSQDDNDRVKILPKRKQQQQQQQQVQLKMMKQQKRQQQQQQQEQRKILMKKTFRKLLATSSPPGLRAAFLKRRLERIGGLNPWLRSQGLGQFAKIFQEQKVSEPQLLNLTMQALKKLGVVPVGPRRKLICAIDQLCKTL